MRTKKPMVAPENFTKLLYEVEEKNGEIHTYTFSQLCATRGIKYCSVYNRVKERGMTVKEALEECRNTPSTWGQTYSNTENVGGMPK